MMPGLFVLKYRYRTWRPCPQVGAEGRLDTTKTFAAMRFRLLNDG
jgi:hypothetical protein